MNNIITYFIFCMFTIFSSNALANKNTETDLNWNPKEQKICLETGCISVKQHQWPNMLEKTNKSDRKRRTDPFSEFNSDSGNDRVEGGITLFEWD